MVTIDMVFQSDRISCLEYCLSNIHLCVQVQVFLCRVSLGRQCEQYCQRDVDRFRRGSKTPEMRQFSLPIEKASGGTGVRTDQTGTRLPPVPLRGVEKVGAEWAMICTTHNLLTLFALANAT